MSLKGKVALVTGAGRGIGRAVAEVLAGQGAAIVVAEIDAALGEKTASEISKLGVEAISYATDVASRESVEKTFQMVQAHFGRLDILVNNAAVIAPAPALEMTDEQWDRVLDVGLKGVFLCCRAGGRLMVEQRSGTIINIASIAAERALLNRVNYCAAKAGVVALTRVLALEWASQGVRVNAVGPGYVNTELQQLALAQGINSLETLTSATPLGRLAEPAEIAQVVAFLASEKASYVTGQVIYADGGWLVAPPR